MKYKIKPTTTLSCLLMQIFFVNKSCAWLFKTLVMLMVFLVSACNILGIFNITDTNAKFCHSCNSLGM